MSSRSHRFHFLDALRGVAAVLVVYWHAPGYLNFRSSHAMFLAVDFFFCLSGFVVAFSYQHRLETQMSVWRFVRKRLIRLYPIYVLGALVGCAPFLVGHVHHVTVSQAPRLAALLITQLFMFPNLHVWPSILLYPVDYPAWSIFFEMVANIGFAMLARIRVLSLGVVGLLYVLALSAMVWLSSVDATMNFGYSNSVWQVGGGLLRVSLSFLAGMVALKAYGANPKPFGKLVSIIMSVIAVGLLSILLLTPIGALRSLSFELFTVALIFPLLVYTGSRCAIHGPLINVCSTLGDVSYPLYLLHAPVISLFGLNALGNTVQAHRTLQLALVPAVILTTGIISIPLLRFYDSPVRKMLNKRLIPTRPFG